MSPRDLLASRFGKAVTGACLVLTGAVVANGLGCSDSTRARDAVSLPGVGVPDTELPGEYDHWYPDLPAEAGQKPPAQDRGTGAGTPDASGTPAAQDPAQNAEGPLPGGPAGQMTPVTTPGGLPPEAAHDPSPSGSEPPSYGYGTGALNSAFTNPGTRETYVDAPAAPEAPHHLSLSEIVRTWTPLVEAPEWAITPPKFPAPAAAPFFSRPASPHWPAH
ncbi:hypothetical protein ACFWAR_00965 [Streptomyces sp. NPDC059917]|uniref:hypothetical protein n=1 Tax=Streptomyces sp. NPDC059917 TaxID=3347002 RepID=UPI00364ED846